LERDPPPELHGQIERPARDPARVTSDQPTCRATIRDGVVTLNAWMPGLRGRGPEPSGFRTITAALADLTMLGAGELVVAPVPRVAWTAVAEEALLTWALLAGYRRVWLPGRVVDADGELAALGHAAVGCPTCGAHWEDGDVSFWESVRRQGWFPGTCLACGGSLPEWSVGVRAAGPSRAPTGPR
jgi:hypothetical protein